MKFSFSQRGKRHPPDTRYAFVKAPLPDAQWELYTTLLSASLATTGSGQPTFEAIRKEIRNSDPDLIAGLAVYFGEQGQPIFRELAFLLTAELAARKGKGDDEQTALLVTRIVRQATDIPKWLEYFAGAANYGRRPGRAIRKRLTLLLQHLDEYQYGRCDRTTQLGLREAFSLLRPRATDRSRKILYSRIIRDQIPVRTTWVEEWHALHRQHFDSPELRRLMLREKWKEGISSFRIGYAVLLENLLPMLSAGVSGKVLKLAAEYLGNAAAVRRSGVSALRLLEAYRSLRLLKHECAGRLSEALEQAVLHSSWARSGFGANGISVIALDVSNSMKHPVDEGGGVQRFDIGPLLAMSWISRGSPVIAGVLGNTWRTLELPDRPILMMVDAFRDHEGEADYATNGWLVVQDLFRKRQIVDRVLIFTDCRLWDNRGFHQPAGSDLGEWWRQYRRQVAPEAKLYLFDLAGYGATALECLEDGVFLIAGWKENSLEVLGMLETAAGR
ncbi:MAG TPA: hypothetical protein VNU70_03320 [Puia sp.]|nr:hypothetical protein [Puia sp.]